MPTPMAMATTMIRNSINRNRFGRNARDYAAGMFLTNEPYALR